MKGENVPKYTEVWGDRVILKELALSCLLGVILTMFFSSSVKKYFIT